jgi:hypothetical protein
MTDFSWLTPANSFLILIAGLALLAAVMLTGFAKMARMHRHQLERIRTGDMALQKREKLVLASALASELTENKIKCEAFITIYTDLLRNLRETERRALYEDTGDFIHQHPPLSRKIYDENIEHLSLLGPKLSADLTQVYAAFRSEPQYFALEKTMPRTSAIRIVEMVLDDAQKTLEPVDPLIAALHVIIRDGNMRK